MFDTDHSEKIHVEELNAMLSHIGLNLAQEEVTEVVEQFDEHGNGEVLPAPGAALATPLALPFDIWLASRPFLISFFLWLFFSIFLQKRLPISAKVLSVYSLTFIFFPLALKRFKSF